MLNFFPNDTNREHKFNSYFVPWHDTRRHQPEKSLSFGLISFKNALSKRNVATTESRIGSNQARAWINIRSYVSMGNCKCTQRAYSLSFIELWNFFLFAKKIRIVGKSLPHNKIGRGINLVLIKRRSTRTLDHAWCKIVKFSFLLCLLFFPCFSTTRRNIRSWQNRKFWYICRRWLRNKVGINWDNRIKIFLFRKKRCRILSFHKSICWRRGYHFTCELWWNAKRVCPLSNYLLTIKELRLLSKY